MNWHFIGGAASRFKRLKGPLLFLGYFALPALASAGSVVLQNGVVNRFSSDTIYEGMADTYVRKGYDDINYGSQNALLVGNYVTDSGEDRAVLTLVRFDLSSLAGKKVTQPATLSLVQVNTSGGTGDSSFTFHVYEVSGKDMDWIAGRQDDQPGEEGEPTWNVKAVPDVAWTGAVEMNDPGIAHKAAPLAKVAFDETKGDGNIIEISLPAALIQKWIDQPSSNGGLLLVWQSGDKFFGAFRSSEFGTIEQRPKLKIDYN